MQRSGITAVFILEILLAGTVSAQRSDYTDVNRTLFLHPRSAAVAAADLAFRSDGRRQSPPSNNPFDTLSQLSLSYTGYYRNTLSTSTLSYTGPIDSRSAVGASFGYLLVPEIALTAGLETDFEGNPVYDPTRIQYGSMSEITASVSYGHSFALPLDMVLGVGGALNIDRRRLPDLNNAYLAGYAVGLDLSATVQSERTGLQLVVLGENLTGSSMRYSDEDYDDKGLPHARIGLGWHKPVPYLLGHVRLMYASPDLLANEGSNLTTLLQSGDSAEAPRKLRLSQDPQLALLGSYGAEVNFASKMTVRAGLHQVRYPMFGAGVALFDRRLCVDLAYLHHQLSGSYSVALTYLWM